MAAVSAYAREKHKELALCYTTGIEAFFALFSDSFKGVGQLGVLHDFGRQRGRLPISCRS